METCKLDKLDWICGNGHITKGVAEGKAHLVICAAKQSMRGLRYSSQLGGGNATGLHCSKLDQNVAVLEFCYTFPGVGGENQE